MKRAAVGGSVPSVLVFALESEAGLSANARFARAALSAVDGMLPFNRYFGAGQRAAALGMGADFLERAIVESLETTFNPFYGFLDGLDDPSRVVDCMNSLNSRDLGAAWNRERDSVFARFCGGEVSPWADRPPFWALSRGEGAFRLYASRIAPNGFDDPRACQIVSLGTIQHAADQAQRRAEGGGGAVRTLSAIARRLGAESSPAAEAALVFEREGAIPVGELAIRLGCKRRTLERELQAVGLAAGKLRLAGMIVGATNQLHSDVPLTQIAADQGFSDLAHMTRAFKASCGLTPSALRGARAPAESRSDDAASSRGTST